MMNDDVDHPLFGKETICHVCYGPAVWVFNGDMVGNYHYCRACKLETGPFAANSPPPGPQQAGYSFSPSEIIWIDTSPVVKRPGVTSCQIDTQMQTQDRMEQLLFDFMKPPGPTGEYWIEYLESPDSLNMADHPV